MENKKIVLKFKHEVLSNYVDTYGCQPRTGEDLTRITMNADGSAILNDNHWQLDEDLYYNWTYYGGKTTLTGRWSQDVEKPGVFQNGSFVESYNGSINFEFTKKDYTLIQCGVDLENKILDTENIDTNLSLVISDKKAEIKDSTYKTRHNSLEITEN